MLLCWYRLRSRLILDDGTIVTDSLALYSIHTHTRLCSMSHTPRQCGVCLSLFAHSSVWSVAHCRVVLLVGWLAMHMLQDELPNPPGIPAFPYAPSAEDHCGAAQPILTWKRENACPQSPTPPSDTPQKGLARAQSPALRSVCCCPCRPQQQKPRRRHGVLPLRAANLGLPAY